MRIGKQGCSIMRTHNFLSIVVAGSLRFPTNSLGRLMGNLGGLIAALERVVKYTNDQVGCPHPSPTSSPDFVLEVRMGES